MTGCLSGSEWIDPFCYSSCGAFARISWSNWTQCFPCTMDYNCYYGGDLVTNQQCSTRTYPTEASSNTGPNPFRRPSRLPRCSTGLDMNLHDETIVGNQVWCFQKCRPGYIPTGVMGPTWYYVFCIIDVTPSAAGAATPPPDNEDESTNELISITPAPAGCPSQ